MCWINQSDFKKGCSSSLSGACLIFGFKFRQHCMKSRNSLSRWMLPRVRLLLNIFLFQNFGRLDATSCCNFEILAGTLPYTANVPVYKWCDVFGPFTIRPLYDIQIGKPMTVSRMMTPRLQTSMDHSQSFLSMFS